MTTTAVRVRVTRDDIDLGVRGHSSLCALATAAARATGLPAMVGCRRVFLGDDPDAPAAALPPTAHDFRERFDRGEPVAPFEFDLEVPRGVLTERNER